MLNAIDLSLCVGYLLSVLCVGFYFTYRQHVEEKEKSIALAALEASHKRGHHRKQPMQHQKGNGQVLEEYYLGGRRIPWWALGIADVSSYIDISGTMINTALIYALGVKGMYIEIRGGLCLFLAFQLAYTGKLSRRCPVKTRGEWIKFRFGARRDGVILRSTIAVTLILQGILHVTYFAVGGGKFFTEFIDIPKYLGLPSEFWAAALLMVVAILYTIVAGFTTVVYTDVYQSLFIFSSFGIVAWMGARITLPEEFFVFLPKLRDPKTFVQTNVTRAAWLSAIPPKHLDLPSEVSYSMYDSFGLIITTYAFLQAMRSASGPGGSGLQTVLATKSEKEVRLQTFLAMVLMMLRWAFSGGVCVLGIHYTLNNLNYVLDPERIVPVVIDKMLPVGIKGFVLASLLAAALTTFDTTINSSSAYWTVDIYQARINPDASKRQLLWHARVSTIGVMLGGLFLSLHVRTINHIWGFLTIAMAGGAVWPFFFSWYWSRFNAASCLCGILAGYASSIAIFIFWPFMPEFESFCVTSSISGIVSLVTCLVTRPTSQQVLRRFFRYARPPGAWHEIKWICFNKEEVGRIQNENRLDLACTGVIALVQLALYVFAVSLVAHALPQAMVMLAFMAILSPLIYTQWYRKLQDHPVYCRNDPLHQELLGEEEESA